MAAISDGEERFSCRQRGALSDDLGPAGHVNWAYVVSCGQESKASITSLGGIFRKSQLIHLYYRSYIATALGTRTRVRE